MEKCSFCDNQASSVILIAHQSARLALCDVHFEKALQGLGLDLTLKQFLNLVRPKIS